jgi:hypothetical protein
MPVLDEKKTRCERVVAPSSLRFRKKTLSMPADVVYYYGVICAWVSEYDLAIEQLQGLAKMPAGVSYMEIRLDPHWDPLRGDPRFEKIVASHVPKGTK